jgi:two-component system NtrC family sensor kinase
VRVRGVADTIELDVEDDGPGIRTDDRDRVFEAYYTTKSQGTGLGLSLVKRAATEMSGTVVLLDSARGAHFRVTVPRGAAAARARKSHRASGVLERGSPRGKRILVVDDDEAMRELLATALGIAGAVVETADSGAAALAKAGPFDLVLIDLGLGDIRGDEVLARMRSDGRARRTALVSGATLPPIVSPGGEPDAWLRKPFEIEELLSHVRTLLTDAPIPQGDAGSSSS